MSQNTHTVKGWELATGFDGDEPDIRYFPGEGAFYEAKQHATEEFGLSPSEDRFTYPNGFCVRREGRAFRIRIEPVMANGDASSYYRVRLTDDIARAIPITAANNDWSSGTEFFVRHANPEWSMVVCFGPDAGLGISADLLEIVETFASYGRMRRAWQANLDERRQSWAEAAGAVH